MSIIRKLLVACMLVAGVSGAPLVWAADNIQLPDLSPAKSKAELAQDTLKKDAICTRCHDETEPAPVLSIYQTKHGMRGDARSPSCQSCHGDSDKHVKGEANVKGRPAPDVVFKKGSYARSGDDTRTAQCLSCHKNSVKHNNWDGSQHQVNGVACNDCHVTHTPHDKVLSKPTQAEVCFACHKEQRADTHKISTHPIAAGKVACSDCHNAHGSVGIKLLKKNTLNETCYQCHADKRGPVLFEHQPVVEDCSNCHTAHGSNIASLLKSRPPFLCDECHDAPHASRSPAGPNSAGKQGGFTGASVSASYTGRACTNCHSQVHGSNSPAGGYFLR
ncbi:DmsE family decaheme c-type cytochrome [Uliginosibacterium gangwonense]|uniref:DmsE family decaheme c-type cytochrome n=1 Tax=Uliginosibacterium gangwonense TaxID=392736 RepID=UPI00039FF606|nr:DmsE family decaheme c-type cytochrome [Uliginosibacterium gangwonense]